MINITRHLLTLTLLAALAPMSLSSYADKIDNNPKVKMETNKGTVIIELYPDKAPDTVSNFLRYTEAGKYDGTIFHRVIKGFMNQGGGFDQAYKKVDTYSPIKNEADNGLKNSRGTIAMARTNDPHSATNQFFISTADNANLNHTNKSVRGWGYCVFGKVVEGMDVIDRISLAKTDSAGPFPSDVPVETITINKVSVIKDEITDGKETPVK